MSLARYRFFILAGIFPYLLGQAIAFSTKRFLNWHYFWLGFLGIGFVLIGVELFNEYFDAKDGGDRIFLAEKPDIPNGFFISGLAAFTAAFFIGSYLAFHIGWPVLLFSFLGFLGAYFYVGPPFKWAYRGLGELVIALCYGPLMVLGSYYLQTGSIDLVPLIVSLICGLALFSLAILNEIPDYYQDRLVGKKNIVVRLGREKAIIVFRFSLICTFIVLGAGILSGKIPYISFAAFLMLPWALNSIKTAKENLEMPRMLIPGIRIAVFTYIIIVTSLVLGYLRG